MVKESRELLEMNYKLLQVQARNQDFMGGGEGVLTRSTWTCTNYCKLRHAFLLPAPFI